MSEDAAFLREQARRCRRLARGAATPDVAATLKLMAVEYDERADKAEKSAVLPAGAAGGEGDHPTGGGGVEGSE